MSYDAYGFPSYGGRMYGGDALSDWRAFAAKERKKSPGISRAQLSAKWRKTHPMPKGAKKRKIPFAKKPLGRTVKAKGPVKSILKVKKAKAKVIEDLAKAGVKVAAEQEKAAISGDSDRYNECQLMLSQIKEQAAKEVQEFASIKKALGDKVLECESKSSSLETKSRGYMNDIERMRENEEKLTQRLGNRDKTLESCMSGNSDLVTKLEACEMAKKDIATQLMATEASEEGFENSLAECARNLQELQNAARYVEQQIVEEAGVGDIPEYVSRRGREEEEEEGQIIPYEGPPDLEQEGPNLPGFDEEMANLYPEEF